MPSLKRRQSRGGQAVVLLCALLVAAPSAALAASSPKAAAAPAAPALAPVPAPADTPPPPYQDQLLRLAEILGAVHYLRGLCGSDEGTLWRDQMQDLIDAEKPDATLKARYIDRFNRGYDGFRSVYRTCTTAATTAIDRYLDEGELIAREVSARYGK